MKGQLLDNTYRLLEEIGRGGFGAVYRAVRLGAEGSGPVAVKVLGRNLHMKPQDYVRFQREATLMSQLVHPGVVSVYELGEDAGAYFIVMEFVPGQNLREHVRVRGGRLPLLECLDILVQCAEALEYVHGHNIIHRDIKPQNILTCESQVSRESRIIAKLVDFGVARLTDPLHARVDFATAGEVTDVDPARANEVVGTYAYMPPEATGLVSWPFDLRADIYSLGTVAFELLAGRPPFGDLKQRDVLRAHVETPPPSIASVRGLGVPEVMERIVAKCLAKHPDQRYQSMFALMCDLRRLQGDLRASGTLVDFPLATKDFGLGQIFNRTFIGREECVEGVMRFVGKEKRQNRLSWAVIRGGVGLGKSRCLDEVRKRVEAEGGRYLFLRFSESEQRLPFQALTLAITDYLVQFERQKPAEYRYFLGQVAGVLGEDSAMEMARFIPALRQFLAQQQDGRKPALPAPNSLYGPEAGSAWGALDTENSFNERVAPPSNTINKSFIDLFITLVGRDSSLVFLLDDIHLADSSTLALFQYMTEQMNEAVNFSFVITMRDRFPRSNLVLESFVRRLASLKRRYQSWDLLPFDPREIRLFLQMLGMKEPQADLIGFVAQKTGGAPLRLHSLVKQMLSQDVLVPIPQPSAEGARDFRVDWQALERMPVDFVSIEVLIASLESLEGRDRELLRTAAISHEACEFEYFRVDADFSKIELETRLLSLVRRGILEMIGDENAPLQRRAFIFSHEKIRQALLNGMDHPSRREIHLRLAKRIESLFRKPGREQLLSLAKHYDGAGALADAKTAAAAFIQAIKIYAATAEHNLARYYIEKAMARVGELSQPELRLARLREIHESEYHIYASQGNFVAASDVCKQLIDITFDRGRKRTLQVFWAQLLLSLGRHNAASRQAREALGGQRRGGAAKRFAERLLMRLMGHPIQRYFLRLIEVFFSIRGSDPVRQQALVLTAMAQFHGAEERLAPTMFLGSRLRVHRAAPGRWSAMYQCLLAALYLRQGHVEAAYHTAEAVERFLEKQGLSDALRWSKVLKALWLDYPMGRIERLVDLFEDQAERSLPSSGLLHFEISGMRAWLRLVAPTSAPAKDMDSKEQMRRRRSDRSAGRSGAALSGPRGQSFALESNNARRILDSGEKGPFTAMALFSDSLRYALYDKIEPLQRATEQLRRQQSHSRVGDAFAQLAFSLQALVSGRQKESLDLYLKALRAVMRNRTEVLALPLADALRIGVVLLPLLAVSTGAKHWPWGARFAKLLRGVDHVLREVEGVRNPKRNPMSALYVGFLKYMEGDTSASFSALEQAIKESRAQRLELIEALGLASLGFFSGQISSQRGGEHLIACLRLARSSKWRLLERAALNLSRVVKLDLRELLPPEEAMHSEISSREKNTSLVVNQLLFQMQRLAPKESSLAELLAQAAGLARRSLQAQEAMVFLRSDGFRGRFQCAAALGADGLRLDGAAAIESAPGELGARIQDLLRYLPSHCEQPVRLVSLNEAPPTIVAGAGFRVDAPASSARAFSGVAAQTRATFANAGDEATARLAAVGEDEATAQFAALAGVAGDNFTVTATRADGTKSRSRIKRLPPRDPGVAVLIAISQDGTLLGWIAVPGVSQSRLAGDIFDQELTLIGLHTGYQLQRFLQPSESILGDTAKARNHGEGWKARAPRPRVDGEIPRNCHVEISGSLAEGGASGCVLQRLRQKKVLISHWRFVAADPAHALRLSEFVQRHLDFYVQSLRQRSGNLSAQQIMLRLSSDFAAIFEQMGAEARFDAIELNLVLFDARERRAVEGSFGGEYVTFSGISSVDQEMLQDVPLVLASDRLVYRERQRQLLSASGWFFATSDKSRALLHRFGQPDFAGEYLQQKRKSAAALAQALGTKHPADCPGLAFFCSGAASLLTTNRS